MLELHAGQRILGNDAGKFMLDIVSWCCVLYAVPNTL